MPQLILPDSDTLDCNADSLLVTASEPCSSCTYNWSNGANTNSAYVTAGTTYVTVTDTLTNCTATDSIVVINPNFNVSINSTNNSVICLGSPFMPDTLTAQFYNFIGAPFHCYWFVPNFQVYSDTNRIIAANPGTYVLLAINSFGCMSTDTITVIDITPVATFVPSTITVIGSGQQVILSPVVQNPINPSYLWSNGATLSSDTVYSNNIINNYLVTVTNIYNGFACSDTANVVIESTGISARCKAFGNEIDPRLFQTTAWGYYIPSGNYDLNADVEVRGHVTILRNSEFSIGKDVKITVKPGATLNIEFGGYFHSCDSDMWTGFIVEPGGTINILGDSASPALVEDAKIGVEASDNSYHHAHVRIKGRVTFNANYIGVYLHDGDFSDAEFGGTRFTCSKKLKKPYSTSVNDQFSFCHIKAVNAGSITFAYNAFNNYLYINEFHDAMYCLDFLKTNLNVEGCLFSQTNMPLLNKNQSAIRFIGNSSNTNVVYTLNVKRLTSNPILNRFEECKRGILVRQRCQVDIDSNYFYRNIVGIEVNNNRRSSYINKSGSIMIVNNDFRYVSDYGVEVWDNPMVYTYIHNNLFNIFNGFQFDPLMEGKKGIYVHNSTKSQSTSSNSSTTTISGNIIKNYRFGIHTMNQEYGQVSDNTILFDVPDQYLDYQLPVRRAGLNFQNTNNISVATNTVRRIQTNIDPSMIDNSATLNLGTLICGFDIDMSNNSYKENLSFNFPTHYRIANTCDWKVLSLKEQTPPLLLKVTRINRMGISGNPGLRAGQQELMATLNLL
jgi:parallel beta-helix repeat protein